MAHLWRVEDSPVLGAKMTRRDHRIIAQVLRASRESLGRTHEPVNGPELLTRLEDLFCVALAVDNSRFDPIAFKLVCHGASPRRSSHAKTTKMARPTSAKPTAPEATWDDPKGSS